MTQEEINALHKRYLKGELSKEELDRFLETFNNSHAEDMADIDEVHAMSEKKWQPGRNIAEDILARDKQRSIDRRIWLRIAAAAVILFFITIGGYTYYQKQLSAVEMVMVQVPTGKLIKVTLADGTQVTLASGSAFKYPRIFKGKERRVYLTEGRAFFEVAHDAEHPFIVQGGELTTTALGTSFIVQHYGRYHYEKVNLYTGKVGIAQTTQNKVLSTLLPGKAYTYNSLTKQGRNSMFKPEGDPLSGRQLLFEEAPLTEVLYSLSSFYNKQITFGDMHLPDSINFSGEFKADGSLEDALTSLSFIYHFKFRRTGDSRYELTDH